MAMHACIVSAMTTAASIYTTEAAIETATDEVTQRCNGDHTRHCCWHAVMAVAENTWEPDYTYDGDPCLVENALDLVDCCSCNC